MIPVIDSPAILALYPASAAEDEQVDSVAFVRAPEGTQQATRREIRRLTERVSAPAGLPVLLAAAVTKARADGADLDTEIELQVRGIAGQVEHLLGRALVEQTFRVTLDAFPDAIKLCKPPLISVDHVKFYDAGGEQRTLDPQDYIPDPVEIVPRLKPANGRRWPDTADRPGAVEVQFRCGYGPDHTAVPAPIQSYILGRIEAEHFPAKAKVAEHLDGLLDEFRVYGC